MKHAAWALLLPLVAGAELTVKPAD